MDRKTAEQFEKIMTAVALVFNSSLWDILEYHEWGECREYRLAAGHAMGEAFDVVDSVYQEYPEWMPSALIPTHKRKSLEEAGYAEARYRMKQYEDTFRVLFDLRMKYASATHIGRRERLRCMIDEAAAAIDKSKEAYVRHRAIIEKRPR